MPAQISAVASALSLTIATVPLWHSYSLEESSDAANPVIARRYVVPVRLRRGTGPGGCRGGERIRPFGVVSRRSTLRMAGFRRLSVRESQSSRYPIQYKWLKCILGALFRQLAGCGRPVRFWLWKYRSYDGSAESDRQVNPGRGRPTVRATRSRPA